MNPLALYGFYKLLFPGSSSIPTQNPAQDQPDTPGTGDGRLFCLEAGKHRRFSYHCATLRVVSDCEKAVYLGLFRRAEAVRWEGAEDKVHGAFKAAGWERKKSHDYRVNFGEPVSVVIYNPADVPVACFFEAWE